MGFPNNFWSLFFILPGFFQSINAGYSIHFLEDSSPPAEIPTDCRKLQYSIPVNRPQSVPIKAVLKDEKGHMVSSGPNSDASFQIQSLDAVNKNNNAYKDPWVASGGKLCQWGSKGILPNRLRRKYFQHRCSEEPDGLTMTGYTVDRGLIAVDGLRHDHAGSLAPAGKRVYRFTVFLEDGQTVSADSNEIQITGEAKQIEITTQPPAIVEAMEKFDVGVRVIGHDGNVLTTGADACAWVELGVPYQKDVQTFWGYETKWNIMYYETIRMRGEHVKQKVASRNWVYRKQLENGVADFVGIQMYDVTDTIQLNATCMMQSFPFSRRPDDYDDLKGTINDYTPDVGLKYFYQNMSYPLSKAIALTKTFKVTAQTAKALVIKDKADIKPKHPSNFHITGIVVEVYDDLGQIVHSGPDSELDINVALNPADACLSVDANFTTNDGQGTFPGSVCSPVGSVTLTFSAKSKISGSALTSDTTNELEITNEIHVASFMDTRHAGADNWMGSHMDAFAHFAAEDINDGYYKLLPNHELVVTSYNHENDPNNVLRMIDIMKRKGDNDPSKKTQFIVGMGKNELTEKAQPQLTVDQIPQMGVGEDLYDFGNKALYPYYSRVSWEQGAMLHSAMLSFKARGWTRICILKNINTAFSKVFYTKAAEFGIQMFEVTVPNILKSDFGKDGILGPTLEKVKATKTTILFIFLLAPQWWKVIREAYLVGITPMQGYQWIQMGIYGWQNPFGNQISFCKVKPICTVIQTGSLLIASTYDLKGLRTDQWERALSKHIKKDTMFHAGTISKHSYKLVTAEFSLPYDAMLAMGHALHNLVESEVTITGPKLATAVRDVEFGGLTNRIFFDEKGNRPGAIVALVIIDPHPPEVTTPTGQVSLFVRETRLESDTAMSQMELSYTVQWPLSLWEGYGPLNPYALPNTTFLNRIKLNTSDGMLNEYDEIVPIPGCLDTDPPLCKNYKEVPDIWVEREEYAPAPFYCKSGCGGNRTTEFDITRYQFGVCIDMDECKCNPGYLGDDCSDMICLCTNGYCEIPKTCICDPGWTGPTCSNAICTTPCQNGRCTSPDVCKCDAGYVGSSCEQVLAVIVTLPVLAFIILVVLSVFFGRWFLKRQAFKAALANMDWRVNWEEEVQTGVGAISMVSTAAEDLLSKKNYVTWKSIRCYAQKINCDTLDVNDLELRTQIVKVKELRHNNIIHFVGACLEWPNVSILTEPCPKGSLEDLLANDNIKLTWDFKYSLLKDICRGMDYLHRSEIVSHGRLKSTNCLVDNRWTCKIAGFGFPMIRYDGPRKERPDKEEGMSAARSLFWTAPELLANHHNLDGIKQGTQAGDVYSFAIIMSEVISREEPYSHEMLNLTPEDILMLVRDKDAPAAAKAKRKWYESGGDTTKAFRPKMEDNSFPNEYAAKTGLRKLCELNWSNNADNRLSFRQSLEKLNEVNPIKGELIDNLINMLEKYSSNLEAIVAERTKELQVEKAKTEQLVSQMLPKKVVEDLKHGRTVEPESFECVTIFFSDLVGFTAIAKNSTPLQVVDLLNDLYTTFDAILDNYDVYKVETIGDAYMVVSGLPVRNGDLHAGEIATMSLDLLSSMVTFKIRHMPGTILQLRVGMHSGPCVAGVVGLKMPRYCLFGDTVNTASRMESSSMALRIHMSEHTANILFKLGGYHLDCRGEREVKGKGTMTTYWLEGKDGFSKPLPGREMAVSLSQHEFK